MDNLASSKQKTKKSRPMFFYKQNILMIRIYWVVKILLQQVKSNILKTYEGINPQIRRRIRRRKILVLPSRLINQDQDNRIVLSITYALLSTSILNKISRCSNQIHNSEVNQIRYIVFFFFF